MEVVAGLEGMVFFEDEASEGKDPPTEPDPHPGIDDKNKNEPKQ
jgi:hypothetical protein